MRQALLGQIYGPLVTRAVDGTIRVGDRVTPHWGGSAELPSSAPSYTVKKIEVLIDQVGQAAGDDDPAKYYGYGEPGEGNRLSALHLRRNHVKAGE